MTSSGSSKLLRRSRRRFLLRNRAVPFLGQARSCEGATKPPDNGLALCLAVTSAESPVGPDGVTLRQPRTNVYTLTHRRAHQQRWSTTSSSGRPVQKANTASENRTDC
ncbi:hypothetical protein ZHAS_00021064 [Anopheles sinensis]|uniref:Uncharacterized protein n=1 Tax=Anopheles sinensis TaxID=74873 RepID=A0A084WRF3_ANOSI|nr:hypothetical protein ZHAS_00021064 [Anopheles sinensis]